MEDEILCIFTRKINLKVKTLLSLKIKRMFEAAELQARNASVLSDVERTLAGETKGFCVDRTSNSMKALIERMSSSHQEEGHVTVATSKQLHEDYDGDHPERITCIVFLYDRLKHKVKFLVLVNNRKYDIANMIKIWLLNKDDNNEIKECSTCLKNVAKKPVWTCCYCQNTNCKSCYVKLCKEQTGVVQCPVCRQWCLDGSGFGVPRSWLRVTSSPSEKAADALVTLLTGLDGEVSVIPRWGNTFLLDSEECFYRPSGRACLLVKSIWARKRLARLLAKLPILSFHVFRKTFEIDLDQNRPIVERSVLCSTPDGSLLQVPNDAWLDVFQSEEPFVHRKVEYLEPAEFRPREDLRKLFLEELPSRFPGASVFVEIRFGPTKYMKAKTLTDTFDVNYDTDAKDGQPTTLSQTALLWLLFHVPSIPTARSASVRVFEPGATKTELFRTNFSCKM
jgi:hypothetical protein